MLVTWWILLIVFGAISLAWLLKFFKAEMQPIELVAMFVAVVVAAVGAGMIWG